MERYLEDIAFSPIDVYFVVGDLFKLVLFDEIPSLKLEDMFINGRCLIFYGPDPKSDSKIGHWVGLTYVNGEYNYFEPGGNYIDDLHGVKVPHLRNKLSKVSEPVNYINVALQDPGTQTCGRWIGLFLYMKGMKGSDFSDIYDLDKRSIIGLTNKLIKNNVVANKMSQQDISKLEDEIARISGELKKLYSNVKVHRVSRIIDEEPIPEVLGTGLSEFRLFVTGLKEQPFMKKAKDKRLIQSVLYELEKDVAHCDKDFYGFIELLNEYEGPLDVSIVNELSDLYRESCSWDNLKYSKRTKGVKKSRKKRTE